MENINTSAGSITEQTDQELILIRKKAALAVGKISSFCNGWHCKICSATGTCTNPKKK